MPRVTPPLSAAVKLQCDGDVGELWIALAINHDLQGLKNGMATPGLGTMLCPKRGYL